MTRPIPGPNGPADMPRAGTSDVSAPALIGLALLLACGPVTFVMALVSFFGVIRQRRWHWYTPALVSVGVTCAVAAVVQVLTGSALAFHFGGVLALFTGHDPGRFAGFLQTLPIGIPAGVTGGAMFLGMQEHWSGRAEFDAIEQRRRSVDAGRLERQTATLLADPDIEARCTSMPLGVVYDGDLGVFQQGPYAVLPPRHNLAMGVIGASGSGKTVTLEALVRAWAEAGKKIVFADFKGTDPELPGRIIAAYKAAHPAAVVGFWPTQPLDMWRGSPTEIANRLLQVQDFSEPYYEAVATTAVRLALKAPDINGTGPVRDSETFLERLDADFLKRAYEGDRRKEKAVASVTRRPEAIDGVRLRYEGFFDTLASRFDYGFSFEDADVVVMAVPFSEKKDAHAAARMMLSDYGNYCAQRKPRRGEDTVIIIDEFSAVTSAANEVIELAERVRDSGGQVVVSAQSYQGLGTDDDERRRMVAALAGGLIVHRCIDPDELLKVAGTVREVAQSWQLDTTGRTGMGSADMHHRMRIDPDAVRQARVGEAWVIHGGKALHMQVRETKIRATVREDAEIIVRRAWLQMREELAELAEPEPQEWWQVSLKKPERPMLNAGPSFLELEAGPEPPKSLPPPQVPPPGDPGRRLLLAVMAAIREGDLTAAHELAEIRADMVPEWDPIRFVRREVARRRALMESARASRARTSKSQ